MTADRIPRFVQEHLVEGKPIEEWIFARNPLPNEKTNHRDTEAQRRENREQRTNIRNRKCPLSSLLCVSVSLWLALP